MPFTRRGLRRQALSRPFPEEWRDLMAAGVSHWQMLDSGERGRLENLIRILLVDKYWEATNGFILTDEIRVVIAALASLLVLGLDYDYYHRVTSIIVSPSWMTIEGDRPAGNGLYTDEPLSIIGQARHDGPVLIAWDVARNQARDPRRGHNVVFHEFAHKLDMLSGTVDGAPPLESSQQFQQWVRVCNSEYELLRHGGDGGLLDPYGAVSPGEFFAVITEVFFDRPIDVERQKPALYAVLRDFYRQDPAARERRAGVNGPLMRG